MNVKTKARKTRKALEHASYALAAILALATLSPDKSIAQAGTAGDPQNATVDQLFEDFLHYSVLGRFDLAETMARELLDHPDLDPVELLRLSEQNERSMETLLILIKKSSIADSASKVLDKIQEGEHLQRMDAERIRTNIQKLGGDPQSEYNATQRLIDSGEYAVPWMIQSLRDQSQRNLWPRVIRALPKIGKAAVNPLVEALAIEDQDLRQTLIDAMGQIGYPQCVPYLMAVTHGTSTMPETADAAMRAIDHVSELTGRRTFTDTAADGFVELAAQFYDENSSVRADARLTDANIWYWNGSTQFLDSIAVPRKIFGAVMAMRCCERALEADPNRADAIALWLAANVRREGRLGMDVESGDAGEQAEPDPTRPADFPRALYFTSTAGPRYAHLALARAVKDTDPAVALGAIAGLRHVAGASSLIGEEDYKQSLVSALRFPDRVVRIRAALTLGAALPQSQFRGSELVTPILGNAVVQTGRRNLIVIDPDAENLNRILGELRDTDTNVIGEASVFDGIERAKTLESLAGVYVSSAVIAPEPPGAVAAIRERYEIADTPIVFLVLPDHTGLIDLIVQSDNGTAAVNASVGGDLLAQRLAEVETRVGRTPITPDRAQQLALEATNALRRIAANGSTVLNTLDAQRELIAGINSANQDLQTAVIETLALVPSDDAQRAVAAFAIDQDQSESLRLTAFDGLAESAKRFGHHLDDGLVDALLTIAMDDANLRIRTAAGIAVGALNVSPEKARRTILKFHRG